MPFPQYSVSRMMQMLVCNSWMGLSLRHLTYKKDQFTLSCMKQNQSIILRPRILEKEAIQKRLPKIQLSTNQQESTTWTPKLFSSLYTRASSWGSSLLWRCLSLCTLEAFLDADIQQLAPTPTTISRTWPVC